ncbi:MAG TPA: class I SAM-dependent methyltransferase [Terriglobales bacterium]|nr:class I SAM-dependent methyltransferase [Terriglobales bacterium]
MENIFYEQADLFVCPGCGGNLQLSDDSVSCDGCANVYPVADNGIPLLFVPTGSNNYDVTETVQAFYEANPFPNYDDIDNEQALAEKARRGFFARLLDEQLPEGARVLECGCGTGQLTNFLGSYWNRRVFGSDICRHSLRIANDFRERSHINNAAFLQMNLFRPAFRPGSFDVVVSNGVLHHTADPLGGFKSISRLVRPGGYIIIGLYNKIGRLTTDLRRAIFRATGDKMRFLDAHMRNTNYNEARKRAWFMDQYKHPQESKHTYDELLSWLEGNQFEFLSSIPKIEGPFMPDEKLFEQHDKGTKMSRFLTELGMLLQGGVDGGLYIMIGRKLTPDGEEMEARSVSANGNGYKAQRMVG